MEIGGRQFILSHKYSRYNFSMFRYRCSNGVMAHVWALLSSEVNLGGAWKPLVPLLYFLPESKPCKKKVLHIVSAQVPQISSELITVSNIIEYTNRPFLRYMPTFGIMGRVNCSN